MTWNDSKRFWLLMLVVTWTSSLKMAMTLSNKPVCSEPLFRNEWTLALMSTHATKQCPDYSAKLSNTEEISYVQGTSTAKYILTLQLLNELHIYLSHTYQDLTEILF